MRNAIRSFLKSFRVGAAAVAVVVLASTSYAQTITTIDQPNSTFTIATAINPVGQIAGYYDTLFFTTHSFLRQPDGTITLFFVNSDSTASTALGSAPLSFFTGDGDAPVGINQAGQIAGVWGNARYRSFLRQRDGTVTTFGVIPEMGIESTQAQAINSTGQITGSYYDGSVSHGFLRQPGGSIITFDP